MQDLYPQHKWQMFVASCFHRLVGPFWFLLMSGTICFVLRAADFVKLPYQLQPHVALPLAAETMLDEAEVHVHGSP